MLAHERRIGWSIALVAGALCLLVPTGARGEARARAEPAAPALVTDRREYAATGLPAHVEFFIVLRYTNRAKGPRFLPGCHEPDPPRLEKLVGDQWVTVFGPIIEGCGAPPTVVAAGATFEYTYQVYGAFQHQFLPAFEAREIPGTYRVRWRAFLIEATRSEELVSNTFTVRVGDPLLIQRR